MPLNKPALKAPLAASDTALARAMPAAPKLAMSAGMGDAASPAALTRLHKALEELAALRREAALPFLHEALAAMRADKHVDGAELALKALELDERCGVGWHILAICREKADDFTTSLRCYETALQLSPDEPEIANDLGRLAIRMGYHDLAEQLFLTYLDKVPGSIAGANNLACAQRDLLRYDEAQATISTAIHANPEAALLWNTLATIQAERGEVASSIQFFDEGLRLNPDFHTCRYNRGGAKLSLGDVDGALIDCEAALPGVVLESERAMLSLARSTMLLAKGDLERGWDAYEARFDPHYADVTHFMLDRPQWTPGADLNGKHLLVMGEQGLGDEVLFASLIPDLIEAVGEAGHVTMAVEQRLVPLFRRSFPTATVGEHGTLRVDHHTVRAPRFMDEAAVAKVDLWNPMASPLRQFRRAVIDFPLRQGFLTPDPARVAHWRATLAALGPQPKVGVIWKSLVKDSARHRFYSPFEQWAPVLKTPGSTFVNLQYGDASEDIAFAKAEYGIDVWTPPGIDLKNDLDDLTALCTALTLVIGPATATTNLAGAAGADLWLISTPGAWPKLGADHYPWYPQARVFNPPAFNDWGPVMTDIAAALAKKTSSFTGT
jgi:tetratricopeptide (TPR) repeat protein